MLNIKREQDVIDARDEQILSWFKLPIKNFENKLGEFQCDMCGGRLFYVRARYPYDPNRAVCPTCAIEILETLQSNLFPNNQEQESTPQSNEHTPSKPPHQMK